MENEKRDMKWALEEAISALTVMDAQYNGKYGDVYKQAADMLRNGGPVVEKKSKAKCYKCECGKLYKRQSYCPECTMSAYPHTKTITARKYWTEQEKLNAFIEKSEPTFEEITHE